MKQEKIAEIELELLELKSRARHAGYKNIIPKLSKKLQSQSNEIQESVMMGFRKRLSNWKQGLTIVENPSGMTSAEKESKKEEEFVVSTTALAEHFNAQQ